MTAPAKAAPMREDVKITPDDIAFAEEFGNAWLDGSLTAKTVLSVKLAEYRASLAHTARPDAGDEDAERVALIRAGMHESTNGAVDLIPYGVAVQALRDQRLAAMREGVDRGMVEVPREPTEAMLCAGSTAGDDAIVNGMLQANAASAGRVWTAMLEAAALAPEQPR